MMVSWRRVAIGALAGLYLTGTAVLAGIATERVRVDRERLAAVRAVEQRAREARARAIRLELEQEAGARRGGLEESADLAGTSY